MDPGKDAVFYCNHNWHPNCFSCTECNCSFDNGEFYSKDENNGNGELPYCRIHFNQKFSVKCTSCAQPILTIESSENSENGETGENAVANYVNANSMPFHLECFQCTVCREQLDGEFFSEGGQFYCEDDYFETFGDTCFGCQETIKDQVLHASDHTWHLNCFKCYSCNDALDPSAYFAHKQRIFCEKCFCKSGHAEMCSKCNKHIVEGGVQITKSNETMSWHPECAKCMSCERRLTESSAPDLFKVDDDKQLFCTEHFQQKFVIDGEFVKNQACCEI